jgi:hypothetical protein
MPEERPSSPSDAQITVHVTTSRRDRPPVMSTTVTYTQCLTDRSGAKTFPETYIATPGTGTGTASVTPQVGQQLPGGGDAGGISRHDGPGSSGRAGRYPPNAAPFGHPAGAVRASHTEQELVR